MQIIEHTQPSEFTLKMSEDELRVLSMFYTAANKDGIIDGLDDRENSIIVHFGQTLTRTMTGVEARPATRT